MICNGDPRADDSVVLDIRRSGQTSTPLQGDTCADTNLQCPVPWNHGFNEDNESVQLPGNSCVDSGSAQLLDVNPVRAALVSSCLRELVQIARSPRRIHAADGTVLGTYSADNHGQPQLRLGRALGVSSAEGTCAGIAVQAPCGRGRRECPDAYGLLC